MIAATQASIRDALDAYGVATREERQERLRHALRGVVESESDASEEGQLRRYVFAMSCLVHHERHGGLPTAQVRRLARLALAVLQVQRISPESARLAYLYGDVHLVMSQISRRKGDHWAAAWEQQLARRLFRRNEARGGAFQALALAIRALRLGQADAAVDLYERAESEDRTGTLLARARLGRIRSLRLAGDIPGAAALARTTTLDTPGAVLELAWEAHCRHAQSTHDLDPMLAFAKADGPQKGAVFLLEAWLWAAAHASKRWLERFPSAAALGRSKPAKARKHGHLYRCIEALGLCHDPDVPFDLKLRELGEVLHRLDTIVSVEGELLVLAASVRWLRRAHAGYLAALTFGRYRALSWSLTSGREGDLLRLGEAGGGEEALAS